MEVYILGLPFEKPCLHFLELIAKSGYWEYHY